MEPFEAPIVRRLVRLGIEEDLWAGDITSELSIGPGAKGRAQVIAREALICCGLPLIPVILDEMRVQAQTTFHIRDGVAVKEGDIMAEIQGSARALLGAERLILNFLQRLSGVATFTRETVESAGKITVLDTRKTTPGWRLLEKYAVRIGGARNHRMNLSDMVLVKNNHVDAHKGGLRGVLQQIIEQKPPYTPLEVEVRNLEELKLALEFKPQFVMLDNMNDFQIKAALSLVRSRAPGTQVEVSGGVNAKRLATLAQLGINFVSMGALTRKAPWVDISLRLTLSGSKKMRAV